MSSHPLVTAPSPASPSAHGWHTALCASDGTTLGAVPPELVMAPVDPRLVDHVLPHVVDAHVHDLNAVQRRAPQLRSYAPAWQESPRKVIEHAEIGQVMTSRQASLGSTEPGCQVIGNVAVLGKRPSRTRIRLCRRRFPRPGSRSSGSVPGRWYEPPTYDFQRHLPLPAKRCPASCGRSHGRRCTLLPGNALAGQPAAKGRKAHRIHPKAPPPVYRCRIQP